MRRKPDSERNELLTQRAVGLAVLTGAVAGVHQTTAIAQEATVQGGDEILVTGSRIRRLDAETASPVQIVTAAAIQESGVATIGELIQKLPSIGGAATNPAVNNGGGDGASNVELRGLGAERTLVLLNGRRFGALGNLSSAVDINSIPVNMIERVEVLKQGAGAVYGSDAIGGVVNFITKTSQEGAEISVDYGTSSESDGTRRGASLSWGATNDTSNLVLGFNYNKQDEISAADRAFSRNAIYFYGSVFEGGSSRVPTGRMFFDTQSAIDAGLPDAFPGCDGDNGVTRIAGTTGASLDDFRCYVGSGPVNDSYNYQPLNLILTPQERTSVFALGTHDVTSSIEMYGEFSYNRTTSGFQIAPLPFDSRSDNTLISADSIYNPFGIDFGTSAVDPITEELLNPNATFRLEALGNRRNEVETWQGQIVGGLRGDLFDTGWNWDASYGYSRIDQDRKTSGYLFKSGFENALGPSFIADDGTPTCGTPGAPISGCVPVNIFNLGDPDQVAALQTITASYNDSYEYYLKSWVLALDGAVMELPAGTMQAAVGFEYRDQSGSFDTDFLTQSSGPLFKDCLLQGETCSGDQEGSYDVKELYGEVLVPVLKDAPFAQSLNLTAGVRWSDYSTFSSTTNYSFKVDWRPIDDLLVRASYADIFRAPTIIDLYQAPSANAATFTDPCVGLTAAQLVQNPNLALACENVTPDGTFAQPNAQVDGLFIGGTFVEGNNLKPEEGDAITFGFVFEPQAVRGLSLSIDYWQYEIDNLIANVDVNTAAEQCVATGSDQFCGYINRFGDGTILQILQPTINLGSLETSGYDFSVNYLAPSTDFGDFRFGWDATYTQDYDNTVVAGGPVTEVAGTYDRQYGNLAKWRMLGTIGWSYSDFGAQLVARYIDSIRLTDPDGAPGIQPDLRISSVTYLDMTASYTLPSTGTRFQIGVNNLTDKTPPILFQNNVTNANTDVETYDTIGQYFFGSITHKF